MKISLGKVPYLYPIPIVLVGTYVEGRINYIEIGDAAVMGIGTPIVAVSLNSGHHTTKGITDTGIFSINIPSADMMEKADYCGIHSGRDTDKSALFTNIRGKNNTPMIEECPVNIECKTIKTVTIKNRMIFIAEVLETLIDEKYVQKEGDKINTAGLEELNPLIYCLDNKYYTIGSAIGEGYREGKKILASISQPSSVRHTPRPL